MKPFSNMQRFYNEDEIIIHQPAFDGKLKAYLFYDIGHIITNVLNNVLNSKRFYFSST